MRNSESCLPFLTTNLFYLLLVVTTYVQCAPLEPSSDGVTVKRQTSFRCVPQPRSMCDHTKGTPAFYDHCIEQIFPCGEEGFTLAYAQKKVEAITSELHHISPDLKKWLHKTELCFQNELEQLVSTTSRKVYPSEESCLALETDALKKMNDCYHRESPALCSMLEDADEKQNAILRKHISSAVNAFRVGGKYYNNSVVDLGIPEAIRSCPGQGDLVDLLDSNTLPVKVDWCAIFISQDTSVYGVNDYRRILSEQLKRPIEQFVYSGEDVERTCSTSYGNYHIISWLAEPNDPKITEHKIIPTLRFQLHGFFAEFHEKKITDDNGVDFSLRERSQCGDGIRQAGEMCDYGGHFLGCDTSCNVRYNYKCSTEKLSHSTCTYHNHSESMQPVLCHHSPRRSQALHQLPSGGQDKIVFSSTPSPVESQKLIGINNANSGALSTRTLSLTFQTLTLASLSLFTLLSLSR